MAVLLLILLLPFASNTLTSYAGHALTTGAYCNCGTAGCVEDYPGECGGGYLPMANHQTAPSNPTDELGIAIVALLLWLRLKA
jgi:hypothetical protein